MSNKLIPAILAMMLVTAMPLQAAFARGGGDGGGGGDFGGGGGGNPGADHGPSDRGGFGFDPPRNQSQQRLYDQARRECNGPHYPSGASPRVNYSTNSFTCFEPGSTRH